jgi:hypothetical protein
VELVGEDDADGAVADDDALEAPALLKWTIFVVASSCAQ